MSSGEILSIALAGLAAGAINTLVGSGTLITFPVLLAFGYAPVTANVSNTVGLVPGSVSGAVGYRRELAGQRRGAGRPRVPAGVRVRGDRARVHRARARAHGAAAADRGVAGAPRDRPRARRRPDAARGVP